MDRQVWLRLLRRFGQSVTLEMTQEEKQVRAFFQPVRERKPGQEPTVLGTVPLGIWLYLGPPDPDPAEANGLMWNGTRFRFLRCRGMYDGDRLIYQWATAEEEQEVCR